MTGMNRLSPLIVRRVGPMAVAAPAPELWDVSTDSAGAIPEELKLFATGWAGGLIFFGTLFG